METKDNSSNINTMRRRVNLWRHNTLRDEYTGNLAFAAIWLFVIIIVWGILTYLFIGTCGQQWTYSLMSLLKTTSIPDGWGDFPTWVHILFGLINAIIVTPIIIAACTMLISQRIKRIQTGRKRYASITEHYVLIGYNKYSASIINNRLCQKSDKTSTFILLTTINPQIVRANLRSLLPNDVEKRVIIYAGDPQSEEQIKSLRLPFAKAVYVTLDGDEWNSPYARNISLLQSIAKCAGDRDSQHHLPVNVLINDDKAYDIAQALALPESCFQFNGKQNMDVHVYNFYENWARLLWSYSGKKNVDGNYYYDDLDFEPLENTNKYVHLVIVGFNSMGKALAKEAMRICHYPNFDEHKNIGKTKITIIDPLSETLQRDFEAAYPNISRIKDVEISFLKAPIEDKDIRNEIEKWAQDEQQLLTIAICLDDPDTAMQMALSLPESVYVDYNKLDLEPKTNDPQRATVVQNNTRTRVLVRQSVRNSIQDILNSNAKHYAHLKIFGTYYDGMAVNLLDDTLAICVNGLYSDKVYNDLDNISVIETLPIKKRFTDWQANWYPLSENERCNNRYQIDMYRSIFEYLQREGIPKGKILTNKATIELLAEVEHRRWIADKALYGFRQKEDGEVRVDDVKIHNCMDDYEKLEPEDQLKDHAIVISAPVLVTWAKELATT